MLHPEAQVTQGWTFMRQLFVPLLVLPLLLACSESPPAEATVRAVRTLTVQSGSSRLQHEYAAEIRPRIESRLSFRVAGKLLQRMANVGDLVKAGQALARIDASDLKLGQDAALAAVTGANAQLALSETEFKRYQELREQGFISALELERRATALKASRAQAEQANAQARVQANLAGYALLVADSPGVVTAVDAEPGAVLGAGTPVLRLAHDGPRDAVFSVPEDRVGAVRALLGRAGAIQLRAWGAGEDLSPATVREVAAAADPATRTFLVKADVGATALRLGQTASVLIDAPLRADVIKLPLTAVFHQGGGSHVWLVDAAKMTVRAQPVLVAGADGNLVVIAGGLAPGQVVVTAGVHALTEGQVVRHYAEPGAALPPPTASAALAATALR
jgi:multidrug efflux system membrane fusion protein